MEEKIKKVTIKNKIEDLADTIVMRSSQISYMNAMIFIDNHMAIIHMNQSSNDKNFKKGLQKLKDVYRGELIKKLNQIIKRHKKE